LKKRIRVNTPGATEDHGREMTQTTMEQTLVLIKPDAVERGMIGKIIVRLEEKGLRIVGMKMLMMHDELLREHYAHLKDEPYFPKIREFMMATPVVALCVEGLEAVNVVRTLTGVTNARSALPGTIRGDWGLSIRFNLIHASDSRETALLEIKRFFSPEERFSYTREVDRFSYALDE